MILATPRSREEGRMSRPACGCRNEYEVAMVNERSGWGMSHEKICEGCDKQMDGVFRLCGKCYAVLCDSCYGDPAFEWCIKCRWKNWHDNH